MGWMKTLTRRYETFCETSESHEMAELKTHYYKASFDQVMKAVDEIFVNKQLYDVKAVSKEHGELFVRVKKAPYIELVATVITVQPFHTAVDFTASTDKRSLSGVQPLLQKQISEVYEKLNQKLSLVAGKIG